MSIRAGVVVAITFQQIDCAPNAEASAEGNHKRLKDAYSGLEKCHIELRNRNADFL